MKGNKINTASKVIKPNPKTELKKNPPITNVKQVPIKINPSKSLINNLNQKQGNNKNIAILKTNQNNSVSGLKATNVKKNLVSKNNANINNLSPTNLIHSDLISTIANVIAPSIVDNFNLKQSIPPSSAQTVGNKNRKKELMKIFKILTNQVSAEKKVRTVNKDATVPPSSKKIVPKGAAKNLIPPKLNLNPNVSKDQSLLNPPQIKGKY